MSDPLTLLHPRSAILAGTIGHTWLTGMFLRPSEQCAAAALAARPTFVAEVTSLLQELDDTFIDGYNPEAFVLRLPSLSGVDPGLRERLLVVVRSAYVARFRPETRLDELRDRARTFLDSLHAWQTAIGAGTSATSVVLWEALQDRAEALRELLEGPDLSKRWIP